MTATTTRGHYADFLEQRLPAGDLVVVVGNCLAESLRLLLDPLLERTVRIPPVFELDGEQTGLLHAALRRADALVVQPVRDDYRGLPLGSAQLAALLPDPERVVVVPTVRHAGLHPAHVVHHPPDGTPDPPVVPYHDLRLVRAALGRGPAPALTPAAVRAVAAESLAELRRREHATDVAVSDLLVDLGPEHLRTVNHPGNPVLLPLAARVADRLGLPAPTDPGRPLLNAVRAPVEPVVAATWGFDLPPGSEAWHVDGREVPVEEVAEAHLRWYAAHPDVLGALAERFAARAALLGLDR